MLTALRRPSAPRLLTAEERLWLVADRMAPRPFVIDFIVEGDGELDLETLGRAARRAAEAHPGVTMRLSGRLGWTRWVASGEPPAVLAFDAPDWDARSPANAPFLERPLDPWSGPGAEILLVRGERTRVIVRAHHALMDAVAIRELTFDLFRALRGEPLLGGSAGPLTTLDIARQFPRLPRFLPPRRYQAVTGAVEPGEGHTWRRVTARAAGHRITARTVEAVIAAAQEHSGGPWRVGVPVDMRRHRPGLRCSGNLVGIVHLAGEADVFQADRVHSRLHALVDRHEECRQALSANRWRWAPLGWMASAARKASSKTWERGRYRTSAVVSNLLRHPLSAVAAPGWTPAAMCFLAVGAPNLPFFLVMIGHDDGIELAATVPKALAGGGRLDRALEIIRSRLENS